MKSRKMLRKMSAALAGVMLLGSVSGFSAFAAADTKTVFTDNFESYTDVTDLASVYSGWEERMSVGTDGDNQFINVQLTSNDDNTQVSKSFGKTYTSGHLNVKYSVKPAAGLTTLFYLTGADNIKEIPRFENGEMHLDWSGTKFGSYTPGKWYDVDVDVDLDGQTYDISVKERGSSDAPMTYNDIYFGVAAVSGLRMQVWANQDATSCFDNIEITHTPAMPYEQDFESIDQSSLTMRSGAIGENGSIVDDGTGNKVFDLKGTETNGAPELQFNIGEISCGELTVEADMKTGNNTDSLILLRNGNDVRQAVLLDGDRGIYSQWNENMFTDTCAANTWYHITLNYNIDKGTMDAEISGDGKMYVNKGYAFTDALTTVKSINFQTWSKESTYIDNVKISHRTVPYDQDFESGNADGLVLTHDDSSVCGVVDIEGNKVYNLIAAGEGPSLTKNLSEISDGKIYVDTDIYPGSSDVQAQMFASITKPDGTTDTKNLLGFNSPDGIRCGWDGDVYLSEYTPNTWYHVNMEIDVATGKMNATISDGNGTTGTLTDKQIFDAGSVVNNIYFQLWKRDSETYAYLDNIKITDSSYIKFADTEVTNSSAKATVAVNDFEKLTDVNSKVILAVYNEGGLLGVNTQPIAAGSSTALEVNYNETDASALTLKAFLWNFNTLKPITECISK